MMKKLFICLSFFILSLFGGSITAQNCYVAKTGTKYHMSYCGHLKYSQKAIELSKAIEFGYTPCSHCKPTKEKLEKDKGETRPVVSPSPPPSRLAVSVQCQGQTQARQRCKRMTKSSSGYCYQHEK